MCSFYPSSKKLILCTRQRLQRSTDSQIQRIITTVKQTPLGRSITQLLYLRFGQYHRRETRKIIWATVVSVNAASGSMLLPNLPQLPGYLGLNPLSLCCCYDDVCILVLSISQRSLWKQKLALSEMSSQMPVMIYLMYVYSLCLSVFPNAKCVPKNITYSSWHWEEKPSGMYLTAALQNTISQAVLRHTLRISPGICMNMHPNHLQPKQFQHRTLLVDRTSKYHPISRHQGGASSYYPFSYREMWSLEAVGFHVLSSFSLELMSHLRGLPL